MRVPKDIKGKKVLRLLERHYGYQQTRQVGSHMRATTLRNGSQHHITVPDHSPIKENTLKTILKEVAAHFNIPPSEVASVLFG